MNLKEQIESFNKREIEKIYNSYKEKYKSKISLEKNSKYVFTIKKFEVFFRLYINENIQVCIRTNTVNVRERIEYEFFNFSDEKIIDLNDYKKKVKLFYKNILKEVDNTLFCPEHHNEMIPDNATKEETDKGWYSIYEQRLLTKLNYDKIDKFNIWLKKVSNKKYIEQQKRIGR